MSDNTKTDIVGPILLILALMFGGVIMATKLVGPATSAAVRIARVNQAIGVMTTVSKRVERIARQPGFITKLKENKKNERFLFFNLVGAMLVPYALVLFLGGIWYATKIDYRARFSGRINFGDLLDIQRSTFPRLAPVAHLLSRPDDKDRGPFTWSTSPYEWSNQHGAIKHSLTPHEVELSWNYGAALTAMQLQLSDNDALVCEWLTAVFASLALAEKTSQKGSNTLIGDLVLDQLAQCCQPTPVQMTLLQQVKWSLRPIIKWRWADWSGKVSMDFRVPPALNASLQQLIAKLPSNEIYQAAQAKHHHAISKMLYCLQTAQSNLKAGGGGVPPNAVIWVKAINRTMWYAIQQVGLEQAYTEAAGIKSHMLAEQKEGAPIPDPQCADAVTALYVQLSSEHWQMPRGISLHEATTALNEPRPERYTIADLAKIK